LLLTIDDKWDHIKERDDMLGENKKLIKAVEEIKKKMKKKFQDNPVVDTPKEFNGDIDEIEVKRKERGEKRFDGTIPEECFLTEYKPDDLMEYIDEQQNAVTILKGHGYSRHTANRILMVFDDLVGSTLFSTSRDNAFKKLNIRRRHLSTSVIMISQAYKEIPKTVRTNFSCLILFEIYSDAELEAIYNEYPMGMKKDQWLQTYHYAVEGDHNFLFYNMKRPKRLRIMKNFDQYLFFKDEGTEEPPKKKHKFIKPQL